MSSPLLLGTLLAGTIAMGALLAGALSFHGALAATLVGGVVFAAGGPMMSAVLLLFFASSSLLSRLPSGSRGSESSVVEKGSRRDATQVLANGGVAASFALLHLVHPSDLWIAGFSSSIAAATADTWATELGLRSRMMPRSIITGSRVRPGISGGITLAGLGAAASGATLIAVSAHVLTPLSTRSASIVAATGFAAAMLDSLLGATVQSVRTCPVCMEETEQQVHRRCGTPTVYCRGYSWITNDAVNALACLASGSVCIVLIAVI